MKTSKFLIIWLVNFVAIAIVDTLWHAVIFTKTYALQGQAVLRVQNGSITPQLGYIALVELIFSFGATYFLTRSKTPVLDGIVFALVVVAFQGFVNHAVLLSWPFAIMGLDIVFALAAGAMFGYLTRWVAAKNWAA